MGEIKARFELYCMARYPSSMYVPEGMSEREVREYIEENINETDVEGDLQFVSDLDENQLVAGTLVYGDIKAENNFETDALKRSHWL